MYLHLVGWNNWWFPPIYLFPRVIIYVQKSKAKGTLIVSQWLSSPIWPLLYPNASDPAEFITNWLELSRSNELILPGHLGANLFNDYPNIPMLAI